MKPINNQRTSECNKKGTANIETERNRTKWNKYTYNQNMKQYDNVKCYIYVYVSSSVSSDSLALTYGNPFSD